MCELATILSIASTAASVAGSLSSGSGKAGAYNAQADAAELDARRAVLDARTAEDEAYVNAAHTRIAGLDVQSAARASYGQSGVDVNTGTALDVQKDIGRRAEEDALNQILVGERQRVRLEQEAAGSRMEAAGLREAASNASTGGILGAVGSLISGGADAYSKWHTANP